VPVDLITKARRRRMTAINLVKIMFSNLHSLQEFTHYLGIK
jgi:hypothetical protein